MGSITGLCLTIGSAAGHVSKVSSTGTVMWRCVSRLALVVPAARVARGAGCSKEPQPGAGAACAGVQGCRLHEKLHVGAG